MNLKPFFLTFLLTFFIGAVKSETSSEDENDTARYALEGRVFHSLDLPSKHSVWQAYTRIHVNGGEYLGFVRRDGTFTVQNIPAGSYIIEVLHPLYTFEPARVEINSKGKYRARKVNHIKTSEVIAMPYPLRMKALGVTRYFQVREQWRITDLVFNPMIMMMVLPLFLIMILPKMMNDPETKKEMEQLQNMTKFELSDKFSNYLAGSANSQPDKDKTPAANKKNQKARKRIEK